MRFSVALGTWLMLVAVVSGCGGGDNGGGGGPKVALLLPEDTLPRYELADGPLFEEKVEAICADCEVLYSNATGDVATQERQAEEALKDGADVLVLNPVAYEEAAPIVEKARSRNVPVLNYESLVRHIEPDVFVSFDDFKAGELQAETLAGKMKEEGNESGPIVRLNGEPGNYDQGLFWEGSRKAFNDAGVDVARKYNTPFWGASRAQGEMERAIAAIGKNGFAGVYAETDGIAGGGIAAMTSAGIDPTERPTTGRDATVAGLQRIITGEQLMTIYEPRERVAALGAEVAVELARGKDVQRGRITDRLYNELVYVPSILIPPVVVTKDNIAETVLADEFVTAEELCSEAYAEACEAAGIS